jgi:predicted O-methyltransferase YrrM
MPELTMRPDFLQAYRNSFSSIEGAFQFDAALMFMAYNELLASQGISGDVLEIGVRQGLSSIAVASLRGEGCRFVAVDLWDDPQSENISHRGGKGDKAAFTENLKCFYEAIDFIEIISANSTTLKAADLGSAFSFCHIDGGHSDAETYHDIQLAFEILAPGGLMALDDYFNPLFPGVAEGAIRFRLEHEGALKPIAIGFNKVLLQKPAAGFSLNELFSRVFSYVPKDTSNLWGTPVNLFWSGFNYFIDLSESTPNSLVPNSSVELRAKYEPGVTNLTAAPGERVSLPVHVTNESQIPFQCGVGAFGLSYHVLSIEGVMLTVDNARHFFTEDLGPGEGRLVELSVLAPAESGAYLVEIDLVWEGVTWFKDRGNPTTLVNLNVVNSTQPTSSL